MNDHTFVCFICGGTFCLDVANFKGKESICDSCNDWAASFLSVPILLSNKIGKDGKEKRI